MEAVEMIEPPPALRISGMEYLMPRNTPRRRTVWVRSQFSALISSSGPSAPTKPALLKVMSRRPNSATARAMMLLISASAETSVFWKTARPACSRHSRTVASAAVDVQIGNYHRRALGGEADSGGAADSAGGASDYCDFVVEPAHGDAPPFRDGMPWET